MSSSSNTVSLWKMMLELGFASCEPSTLKDLYSHLTLNNPSFVLREGEVSKALGMMMCYDQASPASWDVESFVTVIREVCPKIDWAVVVKDLDYPEFFLSDPKGFELLLRAYKHAVADFASFPLKHLINPWKNLQGQLSLLKQAVVCQVEIFSFASFPCRRLVGMEDLKAFPSASSLYLQHWNCLDLLEYLISLFDTEYHEMVRPLLEAATREAPELFCLGLASFPNWSGSSLRETLVKLVCGFLMGHSNCALVLSKLWLINPNILFACMIELYRKDPSSLSRVLDVAQELKILSLILDSKPSSFSLDVAALASRREHLNLDKWIGDNLSLKKDAFAKPCLEFLKERIRLMIERQEGKYSVPFLPLSSEILSSFIHGILGHSADISAESLEVARSLQGILHGGSNSAANPVPASPAAAATQESRGAPVQQPEINFPHDVQEEVNSYYERIYRHEFELKDIIDLFTTLKSSKNPRDQQVFACMIHNLFDEYQYFHGYPDKELALTAAIFGILIQYQLISYLPLGIALRCVQDALKKPVTSKLFKFGLQSLVQFRARLVEWPQYCTQLLSIGPLVQVQPELATYLKQCLVASGAQIPPLPNQLQAPSMYLLAQNAIVHSAPSLMLNSSPPPPLNANNLQSVAPVSAVEKHSNRNFEAASSLTSLNINVLLEASSRNAKILPEASLQDKIAFLVNNITMANLEVKTKEIDELLAGQDQYFPWFASYLVIKRASIEANFHEIYLALLSALCEAHSSVLFKLCYQETLLCITVLLESERTLSSSSDRTLLKNLGTWLGLITLARDRPILMDDLEFKSLLLTGYEEDKLIVVIPFVCKVLFQSTKSLAFQPHNPWLMMLLRMLSELYHIPANGNELKLTLKFEIELLFKHLKLDLNAMEPTSYFKGRAVKSRTAANAATIAGSEQTGQLSSVVATASGGSSASSTPFSPRMPVIDDAHLGIPALASYAIIAPSISLPPALCKLVLFALDFAIREVAGPVVKRSITVAASTASVLVEKDYEDDAELKGEKVKNLMQAIVAHLALVTCREPLKAAIVSNLTSFLKLVDIEPASCGYISTVLEDNIALACAFVEKTAIEQVAVECASGSLLFAKTSPFSRQNFHSNMRHLLPKALCFSKAEREATRIYSDFARSSSHLTNLSTLPAPFPLPPVGPADQEALLEFLKASFPNTSACAIAAPLATKTNNATLQKLFSVQQSMEKFNILFGKALENECEVDEIVSTAANALQKDEIVLLFLHRLVQHIYKSVPTQPINPLHFSLLQKLCTLSNKSAREVVTWFIYANDERKFNIEVVKAFLCTGMIPLWEWDIQLAAQMNESAAAREFGSKFLADISPPLMQVDFPCVAEATLNASSATNTARSNSPVVSTMKEQVAAFFADWIRLCQSSSDPSFLLAQIYSQTFISIEAAHSFFVLLAANVLAMWNRQEQVPTPSLYVPLDAYASFGIQLYCAYPANAASLIKKTTVFGMFCESIGMTMMLPASSSPSSTKAFCRILIQLLHQASTSLSPEDEAWSCFGGFLLEISPTSLPHFALSWFDCVANKHLMPALLSFPRHWPLYAALLKAWFKFFSSTLGSQPSPLIYNGTLRVLLVLLHDFPDFLSAFASDLCDAIPAKCIQFRNLVLSAFPRALKLPDPFSPHLKLDALCKASASEDSALLGEGTLPAAAPPIPSHPASFEWKANLPSVAQLLFNSSGEGESSDQDVKALAELLRHNLSQDANAAIKCNALVLMIGSSAHSPLRIKVLSTLITDSDPRLRYLLLSAIGNQLRFPSPQTLLYSKFLVSLFDECTPASPNHAVADQIVRVLLERLVVNRPHPWGLLVTFLELIKNPEHGFWARPFIKIAPEIERLFNSVARSCL